MKLNRKLIAASLILLFSMGSILVLTEKQNVRLESQENEQYTIPEITKYESSNDHSNKDYASINKDYDKTPVNVSKNKDDTNTDQSYQSQPDEKYYRQASTLQKEFPNSFIMNCQTDRKRIALTFDDGPDNKTTPKILDILNQHGVPATFFVVGKNVELYPSVIKRMIDEGHQVANHSWSHLRPTELTRQEFISEIIPTQQALEHCSSLSEPFYYRPPYGLLNPTQIERISKEGYKVISWSIDSLDWAGSKPDEIQDKVIHSAHPGAIILMHSAGGKDGRLDTVKALPEIINNLIRQGYELVTVHNLINDK